MSNNNQGSVIEILDKIQRDMAEIKNTLKLILLQNSKEIVFELSRVLDNDQKKIAYHLTDGYHSAYRIAEIVKVSITSIHRWWREWQRFGIVTRIEKKGKSRVRKNFALEDFGIEVPDISSLRDNKQEIREIRTKKNLKSILRDSSIFRDASDLTEFAEKIFDKSFLVSNREDLIEEIAELFFKSSKRKQMMFLQALRQQANSKGSQFKDYFESWEKHIKSEI